MIKLLSANFLRLRKTNLIWGSLGICVGLGALAALGEFRFQVSVGADLSVPEVAQYKALLEKQFFEYAAFIGILAAEFISLFLGTEYSDGAIRNKLAAGHSRLSIYLSHLITSVAVALCAAGAYVLPVLAVGLFIYEPPALEAGTLALLVLGTLVLLAAFAAACVLILAKKGPAMLRAL